MEEKEALRQIDIFLSGYFQDFIGTCTREEIADCILDDLQGTAREGLHLWKKTHNALQFVIAKYTEEQLEIFLQKHFNFLPEEANNGLQFLRDLCQRMGSLIEERFALVSGDQTS
jgi:hypothetical protein